MTESYYNFCALIMQILVMWCRTVDTCMSNCVYERNRLVQHRPLSTTAIIVPRALISTTVVTFAWRTKHAIAYWNSAGHIAMCVFIVYRLSCKEISGCMAQVGSSGSKFLILARGWSNEQVAISSTAKCQ